MEKKKYTPGQSVEDAQQAVEEHKGKKPGEYHSQWKDAANDLLGQIQNRDPFHYDAGRDPLYRQAVDRYVRLGRQAMMDTLGKTTALTGGYANSYAQTAGQQSYQGYLQDLSAQLPKYHQMALDQYRAQGKDLMDRYNLLSEREKAAYGQYQKALDRYYAELDRLQGIYDREQDRDYNAYIDDRDFTYAQEQDRLEAERQAARDQAEKERLEAAQAYQAERDKIKDQQWQQKFDEEKRQYEQDYALRQSKGSRRGGGGRGGSREEEKKKKKNSEFSGFFDANTPVKHQPPHPWDGPNRVTQKY